LAREVTEKGNIDSPTVTYRDAGHWSAQVAGAPLAFATGVSRDLGQWSQSGNRPMLAEFYSWWTARITELLPATWTNAAARPRDGVVIDVTAGQDITTSVRRRGVEQPVGLGAAARFGRRKAVMLRPPPGFVLVKHHVVPTAPRRDLDRLLYHELSRITPFSADTLFWRWEGRARTGDRTHTETILTIVPKEPLASAFAELDSAGIKVDFVEVGPAERPKLLPVAESGEHNNRSVFVRRLAWTCGGLGIVALGLPLILQDHAVRSTEDSIAELQSAIRQVEALRRGLAASNGAHDVIAQEAARTGDVLQVLATVTRILPDDSYLTDFALRERQMTISGRTASAPRLITGLSADPAIRDPAFAAPVTRTEGAASEVFSIKAEVAR
jgi:general secretion pathway protein L